MIRNAAVTISRFLVVTFVVLVVAGLGLPTRTAEANTAAIGAALGNMVQHADVTITQLQQEIGRTTQGMGADLGDRKLKDRIDRAQTAGDKAQAIENRIQDMTGGAQIPWDQMSDQLKNMHKLARLFRALQAWREIRDIWAAHYESVMGRAYQVSQAGPARGGFACDEDEFAVNSVEVSTLFSRAVEPVERDFAASGPLRPQDVQVAVLTDLQQNTAGQAESGPGKTLRLAQSSGNGTPAAGGGELDFAYVQGNWGQVQIGDRDSGTTRDDPSSLSEDEFFGAMNKWLGGGVEKVSSGLDRSEPLDDEGVQGAYIDCTKYNNAIPYNNTTYFSPRIDGFLYSTNFPEHYIYVPEESAGGITKTNAPCHETATESLYDIAGDREIIVIGHEIRFGDRYRDGNAQELTRTTVAELGPEGFSINPQLVYVDFFQAANGEGGYATINIPGEGYRLNDGGCIADFSDLTIYQGEWGVHQARYGQPATGVQLAAGGVQVAALPERLPEDRVQVAAAAAKALPNDFYFHSKGNIRKGADDQWALKAIGFKPVGRNGKGSLWPKSATPVLVAVVDTGLDPTHPDIAGAIYANPKEKPGNGVDDDKNGYVDDVFGWNFVDKTNNTWDNNGHGTFIAGIIAARTDDHIGIAGVNPWARILPVKVTDFDNAGESVNLMEGIYYAAKMGARVINVSIGGKKLTKAEQFAIEYANDMGALVIVAAGNDGIDVSDYSPAGIPGAITVAATDRENKRGKFSNFGAAVDIAAPGVEVLSLRARQTDLMLLADETYKPGANIIGPGGLYYHLSGTSFSAPLVAGVASLLFSIDQNLTPDQVKRMILQSAKDIEDPGFDWLTGYGLLDAAAAIKADPAFFVDARLGDVGLVEQNGQNFLQPVGTASANQFKRAWIEVGQGKSPRKWVKASADMNKGVTEGALALVGVQHFTSGGDWTLKLVVEHKNGRKREARYTLALE